MKSLLSVRLQTPRLVLTPPRPGDIDGIYSLAKDRAIHKYLMLPFPYRRFHAKAFALLGRQENAKGIACHVVIRRREDQAILGVASLIHIHSIHRRCEIGYWLGREYWGEGYGREAVGALLQYAFGPLKLRKVYAHTMPGNARSERLLESFGFQEEGMLREEVKAKGRWRDLKRWGALRNS
jgi:RimJ/RimL family protein N-acetyltransferase